MWQEEKIHIIEHPVLQQALSKMRRKDTSPYEFRHLLKSVSFLMTYEATKDFAVEHRPLQTPVGEMMGPFIAEPCFVVAIQRAGPVMLEGVLEALPQASVGHVGIYRDKQMKTTVEYYFRLPPHREGKKVLLCDVTCATAETVSSAIERLKEYDVGPIRFLCLLASKEGLSKLRLWHPDVDIYCLSVEESLTPEGLLLPGIGDAGDRLYGAE